MNYKWIVPTQELRLKILKFLDFIPDKLMIKIQYRIKMGRKLDLKNPVRFTEKIQWYKLYYRDPIMTTCSDKYKVREYIKSKGLENLLVPLYGVYDKAEEIDFDALPNSFVLKTTNGSKTNILCKNRSNLNIKKTNRTLNHWLNERTVKAGREWAYYNIKPRIICEKYLDDNLTDYKFFCFNGEPYCVLIVKDRNATSGIKKGFFTTDLTFVDINVEKYSFRDKNNKKIIIKKPKNYQKMLQVAKILSKDFPHVRVDLYNLDGQIYFGELTFYGGSGYVDYGEFDFELGKQFTLFKNH